MPTVSKFPSGASVSSVKETSTSKWLATVAGAQAKSRKEENDKVTSTSTGHKKRRHSLSPSSSSILHDDRPVSPELDPRPSRHHHRSSSRRTHSNRKLSLPRPNPSIFTSLCGKCWLRFKQTACIKHIRIGCRHCQKRLDASEKLNYAMFVLVVVLILVVIVCVIVYPFVLLYRKHHHHGGGVNGGKEANAG